jgi:predicted negative regulator of RcsB-dependent stress response
MSEIYESDDEQLEKIKRWWDDNGKTTLLGLVVGLAGVFGWTGWQSHQQAQAEAASSLYAQVVNAARDEQGTVVRQHADTILAEFPKSGYAVLATLHLARQAVIDGEPDEAKARLQWVLANAKLEGYQHTARLRLARLALDAGDTAAATSTLDESGDMAIDAPFGVSYITLRGDIARVSGDTDAARTRYTEALESVGDATSAGDRLKVKLAALGTYNLKP